MPPADQAGVVPEAAAHLAMGQACWQRGEIGAAAAAAARALGIEPDLTEALIMLSKAAAEQGDGETALACYGRLAALHPDTPHWALKHIQLLSWSGAVEQAGREAEALWRRWPDEPMVRSFIRHFGLTAGLLPASVARPGPDPEAAERNGERQLLAHVPADAPPARPVIAADPACDVIIPAQASAATALLVFSGTNDGLAMPLPVFDHFLAPLDVTPVYLRDFSRLRYMAGIRSLGDYPATIGALRRLLRERGITRVVTLGNCVGGFAAIRYGVALGAARVVAFHAPTHCPDEAPAGPQQGQTIMRKRLLARIPPDMTDLKPFLEAQAAATRIDLFYESVNPADTAHAARLGHVPGVRLNPVRFATGEAGPGMLRQFILAQENFCSWLADLLDVGMARPAAPAD